MCTGKRVRKERAEDRSHLYRKPDGFVACAWNAKNTHSTNGNMENRRTKLDGDLSARMSSTPSLKSDEEHTLSACLPCTEGEPPSTKIVVKWEAKLAELNRVGVAAKQTRLW